MPKPITPPAALTVESWPIDRPIPYARNARQISKAAIDKVAASLKEFGWRQPIVVDPEGNVIVGHTRLMAAKKLKLATVPVHVARDLTPAQVKAYRLADNRVAEETTWDEELLKLEIEELTPMFGNLDQVTGFELDELNKLMGFEEPEETSSSKEPKIGDAPVDEIEGILGVVIEVENDQQQAELLQELDSRGLKCRALV